VLTRSDATIDETSEAISCDPQPRLRIESIDGAIARWDCQHVNNPGERLHRRAARKQGKAS
jgi:hypothetical protein